MPAAISPKGDRWLKPGEPALPRDLLLARAAGLAALRVRRPRLRLINIPAGRVTAAFLADAARLAGAEVMCSEAAGRDAAAIADTLDARTCDLLVTIGGSGVGRSDVAVEALSARGELIAHGIALQPGRTVAVGRIGVTPVIALPGAPDHAFAAWWALVLPVLDRLSDRCPRQTQALPLARKIASGVGHCRGRAARAPAGSWSTLAIGDLSLDAIARASDC